MDRRANQTIEKSEMKNHKLDIKDTKVLLRAFIVTTLLIGMALSSSAQLSPFQSMYFQNKYIYNPATAGLEKGLNLNVGYRHQWSSFPGAPKTGYLTAEYKPSDKVGLGVNVIDDQAGLLRQTRVMGTYAYHLKLKDESQQLSFGLSLGFDDSRVSYNGINGDISDAELDRFNQLKPYLDADFGMAYTSNNLYIGAALPNMKSTFFESDEQRLDADRLLFVSMISYKIPVGDDKAFKLEPLAGYRIVKGHSDLIDAGLNFSMDRYGLFFQSIYHSNKSLALGLGFDQQKYAFNFCYTIEMGQLRSYTNGAFELGLKLRLFNK